MHGAALPLDGGDGGQVEEESPLVLLFSPLLLEVRALRERLPDHTGRFHLNCPKIVFQNSLSVVLGIYLGILLEQLLLLKRKD